MFSYGRANLGDVLNWVAIDLARRGHVAGRVGFEERLWIVVMFCAWHQRWLTSAAR